MCGIAGLYDPGGLAEADRESVRGMAARMVHRGPDEGGELHGPHVALAIRRLRVMDPESGSQPIANEDGSVHVVLNGEIYGFEAVRERLETLGHVFTTGSDAEVLVHLYEERGPDLVDDIDGMFAFALWDARRRRLLVARDRFGIKPLFYTLPDEQGRFAFASELPPLLGLRGVDRALDLVAIDRYLALSYVPHPRTVYAGIRKLPPGHRIVAEGRPALSRYWSLPASFDVLPPDEALAGVEEAISSSVRRMMRSDVPVGAFLSGGLDSGTVVHHMVEHASAPVRTFSVRFEEEEFDEGREAAEVARLLGTHHIEVWGRPEDVREVSRTQAFFGEPFADSSQIPTHLVSRAAREHVTVALSGDGGDELFGGYLTYRASLLAERVKGLPELVRRSVLSAASLLPASRGHAGFEYKLKKFMAGCHLAPLQRHAAWKSIFPPEMRAVLYAPDRLAALGAEIERPVFEEWAGLFDGTERDPLTNFQLLDVKTYLVDNNLTKVDRMSMANSLEVRVPLLDLSVFEAAMRVPRHLRVHGRTTKVGLRRLMRERLPRSVVGMGKKGFTIPLGIWFRGPLRGFVEELLQPDRVRRLGWFRPDVVSSLVQDHMRGRANWSRQIWNLVCFTHWAERDGQ